jgi:arsenite methyltransferase
VTDMLFQDQIKEVVRTAYAGIDRGAGKPAADLLYSKEELAELPPEAVRWALGVGNPVRHAELAIGETVLDVGSGGGIDTILAAKRVGPTGRAIGLDVLDEMVERARVHAAAAGVDGWTRFVRGEMEAIPLPDASVDVVISNGVINLSPRKSRVLAEIRRVLKPGGRLCIADLTVEDELPPEVMANEAAWAG